MSWANRKMTDVRFRHPSTWLLSGASGSGKTTFVKRFIKHLPSIITPCPEEIIWYYGQFQKDYATIKGVTFKEGLPRLDDFTGDKKILVVIDDLQHETNDELAKLFTKWSHHLNLTILFLVQELFGKSRHHRTISLNAHYICVFRNVRDSSQIMHLARQVFPSHVSVLKSAFKSATSRPYGYLLLDFRQDTPEELRLRTNIFPDETNIVYVAK